jgi:hypothetical protein
MLDYPGKYGIAKGYAMAETNFADLREIVRQLAQAQVRTEARVEELAQAQLRTEHEVARLRRTIETQIGELGARWGMQEEEAFRNGMKTILEEVGFRAERYLVYDTEGEVFWRPDQVELDVVVQDGKVIVIEIKSSLDRDQVHLFSRKAAFYARKTGRQVARRVIITLFTEKGARALAEELGVEICTDVSAFR